jgi:hypothetical protein
LLARPANLPIGIPWHFHFASFRNRAKSHILNIDPTFVRQVRYLADGEFAKESPT